MNTIEVNQSGVIAPDKYTRFKDAEWFPKTKTEVLIGGQGGIGSWLALFMTRAGFRCITYDMDIVESHNLGGQLFSQDSIGKSKVTAVNNVIKSLTGDNVIGFNKIYDKESVVNQYTFSAFDNMAARKIMFNRWVEIYANNLNAIFIDGRLGMEHMEIFCVKANNESSIERYKKYLFEDSQIEDAACTLKQTSHSAAMIASHMMAFFTNQMSNIATGMPIREVPFFWQYLIPLNMVSDIPSEL